MRFKMAHGVTNPKYQERARIQCLAWAEGRSYHEPVNDECTPDFSCCRPDMFEQNPATRWQHYHDKYGRKN